MHMSTAGITIFLLNQSCLLTAVVILKCIKAWFQALRINVNKCTVLEHKQCYKTHYCCSHVHCCSVEYTNKMLEYVNHASEAYIGCIMAIQSEGPDYFVLGGLLDYLYSPCFSTKPSKICLTFDFLGFCLMCIKWCKLCHLEGILELKQIKF